jgi:hypothetical protein
MSLFKKQEKHEIKQEVVPQPSREVIDATISKSQDSVSEVSWIGVVNSETIASGSESEWKAEVLNLLFSCVHELRELRREIRELR